MRIFDELLMSSERLSTICRTVFYKISKSNQDAKPIIISRILYLLFYLVDEHYTDSKRGILTLTLFG
jgi:hypothetical protein